MISSGCGNVEKQNTPPSPTTTPDVENLPTGMPSATIQFAEKPMTSVPKPSEQQTATPTPEPEYEYLSVNNIKVAIDKEGLPAFYRLPDGKKVGFDRGKMIRLREKALENRGAEVITVIRSDEEKEEPKFKGTKEKPLTPNLPEDILSEEEQEKRGIKIIQAPQNPKHPKPINLYIRKGSFEEGGTLKFYQDNPGHKLTIALVDAPFVAQRFLQDSRYDEVKNWLSEEKNPEEMIEGYREYLVKTINENEDYIGYTSFYRARDQARLFVLDKGLLSNEEILKRINKPRDSGLALYKRETTATVGTSVECTMGESGWICRQYPLPTAYKTERPDESAIFLPIGESEEVFDPYIPFYKSDLHFLYFDSWGKAQGIRLYMGDISEAGHGLKPRSHQTYPKPEDFEFRSSARREENEYPFGGQGIGLLTRHEFQHNVLGFQMEALGEIPNHNEYDTDMAAMQTIREAWGKWEKSGFKDNSGYYFVFSLPEGGYILTKNKSPSESAAPPKL